MTTKKHAPYDALERIFHEPNRLAIMSALAGASKGCSFTDLKRDCVLTDGNLSRHLKVLEEAKAVRIKKAFVGVKPRTTVTLTADGRRQFMAYLQALEEVLHSAAKAVQPGRAPAPIVLGKTATS